VGFFIRVLKLGVQMAFCALFSVFSGNFCIRCSLGIFVEHNTQKNVVDLVDDARRQNVRALKAAGRDRKARRAVRTPRIFMRMLKFLHFFTKYFNFYSTILDNFGQFLKYFGLSMLLLTLGDCMWKA